MAHIPGLVEDKVLAIEGCHQRWLCTPYPEWPFLVKLHPALDGVRHVGLPPPCQVNHHYARIEVGLIWIKAVLYDGHLYKKYVELVRCIGPAINLTKQLSLSADFVKWLH